MSLRRIKKQSKPNSVNKIFVLDTDSSKSSIIIANDLNAALLVETTRRRLSSINNLLSRVLIEYQEIDIKPGLIGLIDYNRPEDIFNGINSLRNARTEYLKQSEER